MPLRVLSAQGHSSPIAEGCLALHSHQQSPNQPLVQAFAREPFPVGSYACGISIRQPQIFSTDYGVSGGTPGERSWTGWNDRSRNILLLAQNSAPLAIQSSAGNPQGLPALTAID